MKKRFVLFFLFTAFGLICLNACAGVSDWEYSLPGGYAIWKINSGSIVMRDSNSQENVDEICGFIKEFSYDSRYVFTRNVDSIEENNILQEKYYIFDTTENRAYDACSSTEKLERLAQSLGIEIPSTWYRTSPDPNSASPHQN